MKTRAQKEQSVIDLKDKFGRAKSVVFTDYRGLTMKQLSELRDKLYAAQAEFSVTKNTLLQRAMENGKLKMESSEKNSQFSTLNSQFFTGPIATLFSYDDEISPIKLLVKALKDAGIGKIKAGFLGEEFLGEVKIIQLSLLPTKDELRAKTVGVLAAPLQGMVRVLQGNLRNLVYAISEIQKSGSASA